MNRIRTIFERTVLPFVVFLTLWLVIARGEASSWVIGLPCVLLAVGAHQRLRGHERSRPLINIRELPGFAGWFIWQSLRGGLDVAWKALQPATRLHADFVRYPLNLPPGRARLFMINVVSLLPGTLSADIEGDILVLHVLDVNANVLAETRAAEQRTAALHGIDTPTSDG